MSSLIAGEIFCTGKSLENAALAWTKSIIKETVLTYTPLHHPNRKSRIFKIRTYSKQFVLILRLKRNPDKRNRLQPRSKIKIENEIEAIKICKYFGPELIDYNPKIGAILFKSLPENAKSLTDLLRAHENANTSDLIKKPIETLAKIHTKSIPILHLRSNYKEELYSYIVQNARKICSGISIPVLSSKFVLLHGNPNPGNWRQTSRDTGIWLDFEDTHAGCAEFDFGYLMGHLRILKGNAIIESMFNVIEQLNFNFNKDRILQISTVVIYYVTATEKRFQRYPFIDYRRLLEEII